MKLFVFRPTGHGQLTFSVMEESEEMARNAVDTFIKYNCDRYQSEEWGTDYYQMEVYEAGKVSINDND